MLHYSLKDSTRSAMAKEHRVIQAAISAIANKACGSEAGPAGIGKQEGGVRVNGHEICIRKNNVMDDWDRSTDTTKPEEQAVVDAIRQLAYIIETQGLKTVPRYEMEYEGTPLNRMLDADYLTRPARSKLKEAFTHAVGTVYLRIAFGNPKVAGKFLNDWDNNSMQTFPKPTMTADEILQLMARAGYKPITQLTKNERKCLTRGEKAVCDALHDISFYGEIAPGGRGALHTAFKL